jgi:hypothetical protein
MVVLVTSLIRLYLEHMVYYDYITSKYSYCRSLDDNEWFDLANHLQTHNIVYYDYYENQ